MTIITGNLDQNGGASSGVIAAIVISIIVALLLAAAIVLFILYRRGKLPMAYSFEVNFSTCFSNLLRQARRGRTQSTTELTSSRTVTEPRVDSQRNISPPNDSIWQKCETDEGMKIGIFLRWPTVALYLIYSVGYSIQLMIFPCSGDVYWYNRETGISQWEDPFASSN